MVRFLATDGPERFARVGTRFLGQTLSAENVELIDI
jgi:glutamate racemase